MLTLLISAFLGVFVTRLTDKETRKFQTQVIIYVVSAIFLVLIVAIINSFGKQDPPSPIYQAINGFSQRIETDVLLQGGVLAAIVIGIIYLDRHKRGFLSFRRYSEKIQHFTANAHEGSLVSIIAGDMDFWGRVKITIDNFDQRETVGNDNEKKQQLMDDNKEYQQLFALRNYIKLNILCNHGLEKGLMRAIIDGTTSPRIVYTQYRQGGSLNTNSFQQLLRIGKIKTDFGDSVDIRFYNTNDDDKQYRARFVDNSCIVYQRETDRIKIVPKRINVFPFFKLVKENEILYSVNNLNEQEFLYHKDLITLKWESCDSQKCQAIINFCELLYHYINNDEIRYKMALVYVNSYEIARKGDKRKEFPPFGVLYLAACVREISGWKIDLVAVDEHTKPKDLKDWIQYDVIGFSIISSYSYGILKQCYSTSQKKKDVVILAGGYQAEKFSNEVFRDFNANIIFKGEGEDSIRSFCRYYPNGNYSNIKGIIYRSAIDNQIYSTAGRGCVDIDRIPMPARDLLDTGDVVMKNRLAGTELSMVHMLFSRGCPYNCYYCAAGQNGNNTLIRYRDKMKIVEELEELKQIYHIQGFSIIDDCFLTDQDRAKEICDYIAESQLDLRWSLAARIDNINDTILDALKKAGCIEIKFGVETGSNELLQQMNKGENATVEYAEEAIRNTKRFGIGVKLFIITGLPGETDKTHQETQAFLDKMHKEGLIDRVSLLRYTPLAGSYIYDSPEKFGVNRKVLNISTFEKTRLYKQSHDWWVERNRYKKCEKWYNDMQKFIEARWGDA